MEVMIFLAICIGAFFAIKGYLDQKRRERLMDKYNDAEIVERIMKKVIWQGMSQEQLVDSWGRPAAIDQKLYKTKTTDIFKYNQTGKNRFSSRVRVENGTVVGWEKK